MKFEGIHPSIRPLAFPAGLHSGLAVTFFLAGLAGVPVALADNDHPGFRPDHLLLSRVVYDNNPSTIVAGVTKLPPNCVGAACVTATDGGSYPQVWNNALIDGSFGITSKIVLDQLTRSGDFINSLEVPNSSQRGAGPGRNQMVGSFSSKSEVALNLSTDRRSVTFMG